MSCESAVTPPQTTWLAPVAAVTGGILFVDQLTKLISAQVGPKFAGLNHPVRNDEFSLGLATAPWGAQVALMAAGLLIAAAVLIAIVHRGTAPAWAAGSVLGGALSNLIDRAVLGSVRDFLSAGPVVLNLADIAVLVGLLAAFGHASRTRPSDNVEGR